MDIDEEKMEDEEFEKLLEAMQNPIPQTPAWVYVVTGLIVLAMPIGVIFGLNTIFGMGVEYNLLNWIAIEILLLAINSDYSVL